jgi:hypothetical protein
MNKSPRPLMRRALLLAACTLIAALTTAAFTSTSAAKLAGRLFGESPRLSTRGGATRAATEARHHASNAPALRRALAEAGTDAAFVTTDQTDYKPGDTVVIFGNGWAAGETVKLVIHEEQSSHDDKELSASADEYGNILNKEFSPTQENLGSSFTLTATGQSSGRTASAKFTDGGSMSYSLAGFNATVFSGPSGSTSASFTQNVTAPAGNGSFRADAQVTPTGVTQLPATWVTVTPSFRNFNTGNSNNGHTDSNSWNVTITPPANTAAGVYTATLFAVPNNTVQKGLGTAIQLTVSADNSPPSTSLSAVDASNNPYTGVNFVSTAKVTITLTAMDNGGSGVASTRYKIDNGQFKTYSGPFDITNEGVSAITYFSTDNTGAQETSQFFTVKIDRTAPTITCGAADGQWHADDVSIQCTATDAGGQQTSGLANSPDAKFSLSTNVPDGTETNNAQTGTHAVCDNAGNCATAGPVGGNMVDKKAPTFNCGGASANWINVDAVIPCTASDGGSGTTTTSFNLFTSVPADTEDSNASTDSRNVCDAVGHCPTAGPVAGNKVDKKPPTITASAVKANNSPYNAGDWTNQSVVVSYQCSDGGSGVASVDGPTTLSGEGAGQSVTGNCTDNVGNSAHATFSPVNIDKTPPTINATRSPAANAFGWNNTDVTASYTASDGLSGLTDPATGSFVFSTEGANQSHTFTVHDVAGNSSAATVGSVNIDKSAPSVTINAPTAATYLLNQSVAASFVCSDAGSPASGIDTCTGPVNNGSNIDTSTVGSHTFTVTAKDKAGNTAPQSVTYNVIYAWSGLLQPINLDGSSVFKLGSTVPVKFQLLGGSAGVTNATGFALYVAKVSNNVVGTEEAAVTSTPASTGNLFRYDPTSGQYLYNMGTKGGPWTAGTWQLRVDLGDGAPPRIVLISLKP